MHKPLIESTFKYMKQEFPDLRLLENRNGRREDVNLELSIAKLRTLKRPSAKVLVNLYQDQPFDIESSDIKNFENNFR